MSFAAALVSGQALAEAAQSGQSTQSTRGVNADSQNTILDEQGRQRVRIAAERRELEARFAAQEAACQAKFFVNACLNAMRPQHREALADLRRQDFLLDDAERKLKAEAQLQKIEEKGSEQRKLEAAEKAQENVRLREAGAAEAVKSVQEQSQKASQAAERRRATLANQAQQEAEAADRAAAQTEAEARAAELRQRQHEAASRKAERGLRMQQQPPSDRQPLPSRP